MCGKQCHWSLSFKGISFNNVFTETLFRHGCQVLAFIFPLNLDGNSLSEDSEEKLMQFPSFFPSMYKNDDTQHRGRWICISCCRGRSESCIFFPAFMYSVFGNCKRNCAKILCKLTLRRKMLHCYCSSTFYQPQGWTTYSADPGGGSKRRESGRETFFEISVYVEPP